MTTVTPSLGLLSRFRLPWARAGSLLLDGALLAYAAWALAYLVDGRLWEGSFLGRRPRLLAAAPVLALLWQATGTSPGLLAYGLRRVGPDGSQATLDRRALSSLAGLVPVGLVLLPLLLLPYSLAVPVALGLALILALLAASDAERRSLPERLAGIRSTFALAPSSEVRPWFARPNAWCALVLLLLTSAVGLQVTGFSVPRLIEGVGRTEGLWSRMLDPDWTITERVIAKMVETIFLALVASVLALPFALPLGFVGARTIVGTSLPGLLAYGAVRLLMNLVRSIEPLVWGLVFVLWVGVGPFAGVLALFVHSVASLGKLYSEAVEAVDPGPVEAIRSTGADSVQTIRFGVFPQVVPAFLSFTVYRWDINVRMATVLGLVGGGGIGEMLLTYQQVGAWSKVSTIMLFVTLVVWLLDLASSRARRRIV